MLHHLIITRFSVHTKLAGRMRRRDADDAYLKYRMALFDRFCAPSVEGQSVKGAKWFVLFGAETPDWLRIQLDAREQDGRMIPLYSSSFGSALDSIREWVRINMKPGDQLLTTRLDNDDAIGRRFSEILRDQVQEDMDLRYFCFRYGQQVRARSNDPSEWRYFRMGYPANPFVSMVERIGDEPPKLIYHVPHGSIKSKVVGAPVQALSYYPGWLQVLHGKNLGNGQWTRRKDKPYFDEYPFLRDYEENGLARELHL